VITTGARGHVGNIRGARGLRRRRGCGRHIRGCRPQPARSRPSRSVADARSAKRGW